MFSTAETLFTEHPAFFDFEGGLTRHWLFRFPNGYGASVISGAIAYGSATAPYELGVVKWNTNEDYQLCYNTPIAQDVIGHQTEQDVLQLLDQIQQLPDRIDYQGNLISRKNVQLAFDF